MKAHLFYMRTEYASIGTQPIKTIEIESTNHKEIMEQLTREFEEILKLGDHYGDMNWEAQLKVLYEHPQDNHNGYYFSHIGEKKVITPAAYAVLIPVLNYKNKTLTHAQ